jgi:hypothetical protein
MASIRFSREKIGGDTIYFLLWHHGIMMPKRTSKKSKPRDISQLARAIVEEATGESLTDESPEVPTQKPPAKRIPPPLPWANLAARRAVTPAPRN